MIVKRERPKQDLRQLTRVCEKPIGDRGRLNGSTALMSADVNVTLNNAICIWLPLKRILTDYKERRGWPLLFIPPLTIMDSIDLNHAGTVLAQATLTGNAISLIVVGMSAVRPISERD